ncbi:MAG: 3-hydroxybutyrate dehydrogenase [Alphaproteobacteria bacterium]|nr:3-hydroxybutyrate dehydrogenase [Alphaproteobacteria bacterium]
MLKNKVALVTGATSGIGLAIARALAAQGCAVVVNGSRAEREIIPLTDEIGKAHGVKCLALSADMASPPSIAAMLARTVSELGPIDILVNNAGVQHVAPLHEFPPEKWDQLIAINLSSAFHTSRAVLGPMMQRGWGRIVNIASAHGLVASPYKSAYVAAKHGLLGLTKVTALEAAEKGVTCNAICPGYVWTPLVEKQIPDQAKAHGLSEKDVVEKVMLAPQPNKKFATVEEIAALTVFLCSDMGASITGASLPVDGGWTAR